MTALFLCIVFFGIIPWRFGTFRKLLIAFDQLINAYFKGWPDETLSSRAWRWQKNKNRSWPCRVIDTIFFFEPEHCRKSYENERNGRQSPPELRPE